MKKHSLERKVGHRILTITKGKNMLALLISYADEKVVNVEVVELPNDYDGNPYGDKVPFSVGSNQTIEIMEE